MMNKLKFAAGIDEPVFCVVLFDPGSAGKMVVFPFPSTPDTVQESVKNGFLNINQ